jgi:NADH dehydrogenase
MILVTGGTGFVGQALVRQLVNMGHPVRLLLRPSAQSPSLPRGVPVEVAMSSLRDERGLRAAMKGVRVVYHLAGAERQGLRADLEGVDVEGSQNVAAAAAQAGVERIFYLSHLGADRASAYPVLKAKALAEGFIQGSGVPYTIFRSAHVFGPGDQFTTSLAGLLRLTPLVFFMPGDGSSLLQPMWIEDLITCLTLSLSLPETVNHSYEIGGAEYFSFRQVVEKVMAVTGLRRSIVDVTPAYLRSVAVFLEQSLPSFPISLYWFDSLASDRICGLDTLPRQFGLMPSRMGQKLDYLVSGGKKRRKG